MKHILIAILTFCAISVSAQSYRTGALTRLNAAGTAVSTDTLINTDTGYLWDGRIDHNQWSTVSLKFLCTEVTGTTGVTMVVQGSNDATTSINGTWTTLSNYTTGSVGLTDTGAVKNTTYIYQIPNCNYRLLRIRAITSGTQRSVLTGSYYLAAKFVGPIN